MNDAADEARENGLVAALEMRRAHAVGAECSSLHERLEALSQQMPYFNESEARELAAAVDQRAHAAQRTVTERTRRVYFHSFVITFPQSW